MTCTCPKETGDSGPRVWRCEEHPVAMMTEGVIIFRGQTFFENVQRYHDWLIGLLAEQRELHHPHPYYDEDEFWPTVRQRLIALMSLKRGTRVAR